MGKILSTANDILDAVQDVAGRGRITRSNLAVAELHQVYVKVPYCKVRRTEDYLKLHSSYALRFIVEPLDVADHLFLWSTKYQELREDSVLQLSTRLRPIHFLSKLFKA